MKKFCIPIAAALLLGAACTGCAPESDPDAMTILGKTSDLGKPYMTEIFDHYRETTGESLNILAVEDSEFEDEAIRLFGTEDAPDILLHFHNADLNRFRVEENFLYLNDMPWVNELTDSARAYCTDAQGHLLGLPFWESSVSGCYYNKKLLKGLGVPTTQEDFDGLCDMLLRKGITPILWPGQCSWMAQLALDPVFADAPDGPSRLEKLNAGEIKYEDISSVTDMVTWIANAAQKGWFGDRFLDKGWNDISEPLASGEAAMTFIWDTWFYTNFKPGQYKVEDFALMPIFMNTAPQGTYEGGNLNMMIVNKNSPNKDRALAFLEFCATPENYNVAFNGISTVSVFKGQTTNIQSQMVTDAKASIARQERVSTASTKIVGYNAEDVMHALNALLRGEITPEGCVKRMDEQRIEKSQASVSDAIFG